MRLAIVLMLVACSPAASPPPASPTRGSQEPQSQEPQSQEPQSQEPQSQEPHAAPARIIEGRASFYSDRLAGRRTANGERYDPTALTAASRDLPFGTRVRVVRVDTGASVIVRVNDRGPFRDHGRILDLSRAAAEALDMVRAGVVSIRAEVLE